MHTIRLLFVGDVSGQPGRRAAGRLLDALRSFYEIDFIILNGENAAGGLGITRPTAVELFNAGVDVITLGNHAFAKQDALAYVDEEPHIIRPANYPHGAPGKGWGIFALDTGDNIAVINLLGRTFMAPMECPFKTADAILAEIGKKCNIVVVDMHAEATSEKKAIGWYVDGRVTAVIGTHTHVQTSDERVLPGGTAYISDAGMTGVHDSVLGLDKNIVIERFKSQLPGKFVLASGMATLQGVVIDIDSDTGKAINIRRISVDENQSEPFV